MSILRGVGKRKTAIIYVQRGIVNAWDKVSFREHMNIHPNGWKMYITVDPEV